jgi:hypothetical protein
MGTSGQRNLTVVEADGTQVQNILLTPSIQDMVKFDHLGGLEEIATIQSDGDIVVYSGLTLGVSFTQNADPSSSSTRHIGAGDFNADPQDDLVVISRDQETAYFRDGNIGALIREIPDVYTFSTKQFAIGSIDQDALDDLAIGSTLGGLSIIRGLEGEFAHIEYLIDVSVSSAHQILSYDVVGNGIDDVVVRLLDGVWIIRSDTTKPILTPLPIDPVHPTILDDYVTIEVHVNETSRIEYVDIWMKMPGSVLWMQPQDEMFASHQESVYYAFIGDLQPGEYQYYINVQDSYLNTGQLGNATHPEIFSVAGDFVWQIDKTETDFVHKQYHQSDIGNLSDGTPVIYTIERAKAVLDLTVVKYSRYGGVIDSLTIVNPSGIGFDNFALFSAMLDGDSILDIIVLDYHWDKGGILRYHVYDGSTFSLMDNGTVPFPYKSFNHIEVFDDDGDGNEELFIASDTQPYNVIKMDSDLTWTGVDLPFSGDGRYGVRGFTVASGTPSGYIGVVRGDIQVDILTTDLVYSHSLDIDLSAYPNMEYAGIDTMYNATSDVNQFVAGFTYWNGSDATGRVYVFDSSTTNVNNTPVYQVPHHLLYLYPADARGDSSDELILKLPGDLMLTDLGSTLTTLWSTPTTGAQPLTALIADFDGDSRKEFIMFTDQDEHLTQYSLYNGVLEWTVKVGEVHNPLLLGDIDSIPGDEIAAYPFATVSEYTLGVVRNIDTHYVLNVTMEFTMTDVIQTGSFDMNVTVLNIYGESISGATVYMDAQYMSPEGPAIHTFGLYWNWMEQHYWGATAASWPMGVANLSLSVAHHYYHHYRELFVDAMTVRSPLRISLDSPPFIGQGDNMTLLVSVTDNLDRLVEGASVSVILGGVEQTATPVGLEYMVHYPEVQLDPGTHLAEALATHPFSAGAPSDFKWINVRILASSLLVNSDFPSDVQQDELVPAWFNITDQYGSPLEGAMVSLVSGPNGFGLVESTEPGCYRFDHQINLGLGHQAFELRVESPIVFGDLVTEIEFEVRGDLTFFVSFSPEEPVQGQSLYVSVVAVDGYGNPVPDLDVTVSLLNMTPILATETDQMGEYVALIEHIPFTEGYGLINVTIEAIGEYAVLSTSISQVNIDPATPDFTLISAQSIGLGIGASFLLSMIGMMIYFRMASSMRVDDSTKEGLHKSVRNMDRLYIVIVAATGLGIVSSYSMYQAGEYAFALIVTVALLGGSVLLYGLWLYRDATSAVMLHGKIGRKRMVLGLWHLVFVPLVIFMMLLYGVEIDWFKANIIDQTLVIGGIVVPTIMTTIFAAYISSILVVVVNHYREVSKGIKKITKMEEAGTPDGIVEDERTSMVSKFSSSIRVKFLMFLVVVGATTVMSMDFLASWELGVIVLLPVAFLVVIPFISSKIIHIFSRISRGRIPAAPADV